MIINSIIKNHKLTSKMKMSVMIYLLVWFSSHIHLRRPSCSQLMFSLSSGVIQGIWFIDYNFHKKIKQSSPTAESPELWTKKVILVSLPASSDWALSSHSLVMEWPWQYSFPPFFTLQPHRDPRTKQMEAWRHLVLNYCLVSDDFVSRSTWTRTRTMSASCQLIDKVQ